MSLNPIAKFFDEVVVDSNQFSQLPLMKFDFRATGMMIAIDSGDAVEYSFDGKTRHGKLYSEDSYGSFDDIDESKIWFRKVGDADVSLRLWAWEKKK